MRFFVDEKIKTEITAIVLYFNMWFLLGWYDIKQKYRRSFIGPFWITFSTGVMVGGIGLMFSVIFKSPVGEFLSYFAVGQIIWLFISTQINESCTTFILYQSIIKQMSVPLSVHIMRKFWNNLILLGHNALIIIIVLLLFAHKTSWKILYAIPALILIMLLLFLISIMLAIICTRFRDITQIVAVFMQLIYFFTPILWMKKVLPDKYSWVSDFNPFYHMVEIVRAPLLGTAPAGMLWLYMLLYIAIAAVMALFFLKLCRHRVSYWL
jgi:ABC-type polysaccharide/polyol phosphate export permease